MAMWTVHTLVSAGGALDGFASLGSGVGSRVLRGRRTRKLSTADTGASMSGYEDRYGARDPLDPPDFVTHSAKVDIEVGRLSEFHDHLMAEYNENFVPNWEKLKQEFAASKF